MDSSYGAMAVVFDLTQNDAVLTGTVEGNLFTPMEVEQGKISDGQANWKVSATQPMSMTLEFRVVFDGDSVSGEASFGEYGDGKVSGGRRKSTDASSATDASSSSGLAPVPLEPLKPTVPPEEISPELLPIVEELGLVENCRQLAQEGWTVVENAADPEFMDRLRKTILNSAALDTAGTSFSKFDPLGEDPIYAEAALNPSVMALAEFSVGRGFLLGSMINTIRFRDDPALPLHADQGMFPAPFPQHNMMLTACWALDEFTEQAGATRIVPGSNRLLRHPTEDEVAKDSDSIAIECPAGSVTFWDGRVWHGNCARAMDGERVVVHSTYYRLLMRPGHDYSDVADELIETHGEPMSQLLGREDYMYKKSYDYVNDYGRFVRTLNNAKS